MSGMPTRKGLKPVLLWEVVHTYLEHVGNAVDVSLVITLSITCMHWLRVMSGREKGCYRYAPRTKWVLRPQLLHHSDFEGDTLGGVHVDGPDDLAKDVCALA